MANNLFCSECGKPVAIVGGQNYCFCAACGTKIAAPAAKTKGKGVRGIVATALTMVLLGGMVLFYFVLSGSSYEGAESAAIQSLFSSISDMKNNFRVAYEPAAWMNSQLDLGIPDISIDGTISYSDSQFLADMNLKLYNETLTNLVAALDDEMMILALPTLTDYYLRVPASDYDEAALEKTMANILKAYFKRVKSHTVEDEGVSLSVGNMDVVCDSYTIDFTADLLSSVLYDAFEEILKNDDLLEYGDTFMSLYGYDYYYNSFEEMLEEAMEELKDVDDDEHLFRMIVWVKNNQVVGRRLDNVMDDAFYLNCQQLSDDDNKAFSFEFSAGDITLSASGDLTKEKSGWNGSGKISLIEDSYYNDVNVAVNYKVTDYTEKEGMATGLITADLLESGSKLLALKAVLSESGKTQNCELSGEFLIPGYGNFDLGSLTLDYSSEAISSLKMPEFDEAYAIEQIYDEDGYDFSEEFYIMMEEVYDELSQQDSVVARLLADMIYDAVLWYYYY